MSLAVHTVKSYGGMEVQLHASPQPFAAAYVLAGPTAQEAWWAPQTTYTFWKRDKSVGPNWETSHNCRADQPAGWVQQTSQLSLTDVTNTARERTVR
jgi:hypothetical protein